MLVQPLLTEEQQQKEHTPHKGAVTHHHDHVATTPTSANFKTKNTKNVPIHMDGALSFCILKTLRCYVLIAI